jgi:hypothetical protein
MCTPFIVARYRLCKHVPAATNTHRTIELLEAPFFMLSVSYQRKAGDRFFPELLPSDFKNRFKIELKI